MVSLAFLLLMFQSIFREQKYNNHGVKSLMYFLGGIQFF